MWSRGSRLLYVRVLLRGMRPRLSLRVPVAMYVLRQFVLSAEPFLELLPGSPGRIARRVTDGAHSLLIGLMDCPPATIADVNVGDGKKKIRVKVRTI